MRRFIGVSFLFHAILILSLVDINFSARDVPTYDVYEVSIVSSVPSDKPRTAPVRAKKTAKKYFYRKGSDSKAISGIKKEKGLRDHTPQLSPADIEPEIEQDTETLSDTPLPEEEESGVSYGDQGAMGQADGSSNPVVMWKAQVRSLVDSLWKTPPEISILDMSLLTTYLLKISRTGELLERMLLVSSGNRPFDRSVLLALNSIETLPVPPLVLIAGRDTVEITMSFTPPKGAE